MTQTDKMLAKIKPNNAGNMNGWKDRHNSAVFYPKGAEVAIVTMLDGWLAYADIHKTRFESPIGDDYVLGPEWAAIGSAILGLLNGDLGRLDGGTLDGLIRNTLAENGVEGEV